VETCCFGAATLVLEQVGLVRKLEADRLVGLRKQAFERFCWRLLTNEYERCFEPGAVEFRAGPSPEDVADGGRDLEVEVLRPPAKPGHWSLLPRGRTRFSCKTTKDEAKRSWADQVRRDLGQRVVFDGKQRRIREDAEERAHEATQQQRPSSDLLNFLAKGGAYWVLINVAGHRIPELEDDLGQGLSFWIQHELHEQVDLAGRIKIKDATFLAEVFDERPFTLSVEHSRMFELDEPEGLSSWETWTQDFEGERRMPEFEVDDRRRSIIAPLRRFLREGGASEQPRVFRLGGAPGVGKTRLVHHVLEQERSGDLHSRVRYTREFGRTREWVERGGLDRFADLVLAIDEVPPDEAHALWRVFERKASGSVRVIMIGPLGDDEDSEDPPMVRLGPLDDQYVESLIRSEIREQPDKDAHLDSESLVETVRDLSEGFPLFVMWLTQALARDPGLLEDPRGELTDRMKPWRAAMAVLAGPRTEFESKHAWEQEAELRAKALLLVVMFPDHPWSADDDRRNALTRMLEVTSWSELRRAAGACRDRGLLRDEPADHYYVSPANLERLVLNHLFGGPPGLDPGPLRQVSFAAFERLLRRAARVRSTTACRDRLARAFFEQLDPLEPSFRTWLRALPLVAYLAPERASSAVARLVDDVGAAHIADDDAMIAAVRSSLEHLRHRKLDDAAFASVEHALFSLAVQPEQEPWGNNARSVWASLFGAVLHQTHRPFEERMALLRRRLDSSTSDARIVAIDGLDALIGGDSGGYHPQWDDVDGPWEHPTNREWRERQELGWRWLVDMSGDAEAPVAHRARGSISRFLAAGVESSAALGVLDELPDRVESWSLDERNELRDALEWVLRGASPDDARLDDDRASRLQQLKQALAPISLPERVFSQVGRQRPGDLSLVGHARMQDERDRDRALARELLAQRSALDELMPWLLSSTAVRALVFGHALGTEDEDQSLLPALEALGPGEGDPARSLLVGYLLGWAERSSHAPVDAWLEARVGEPKLRDVVASVIVALGGSDRRARLLTEIVGEDELARSTLRGLGFWSWHEGVSTSELDGLIRALARSSADHCNDEALGMMARRLERPDDTKPELVKLAHRLLAVTSSEHLGAAVARDWGAVASMLRERGDPEIVRVVLSIVVSGGTAIGYLGHAVRLLEQWRNECPETLWEGLIRAHAELEAAGRSTLGYLIRGSDLTRRVSPTVVLDWVGHDEQERAKTIAGWSSLDVDVLPTVLSVLLIRFGPHGRFARDLSDEVIFRSRSGGDALPSMLARVAHWARDPHREVATWAKRVELELQELAERRRQLEYA